MALRNRDNEKAHRGSYHDTPLVCFMPPPAGYPSCLSYTPTSANMYTSTNMYTKKRPLSP